MRSILIAAAAVAALTAAAASAQTADENASETMPETMEDPRMWLEEVEGEAALSTVRAWNERSLAVLQADPRFAELEAAALDIVNAQDKIPYGAYRGDWVYNFWQDETHVRGLVRRTSLESYLSDDTEWDIQLDMDALAEAEDENWVYKGSSCLPTNYDRCLLTLSDGGKDASVRREWDHGTRSFVEGGFELPEAKAGTAWVDQDTLLVATNWGEGTVTESGYPFIVKRLERGQALEDATEIIRGQADHVGVWPFRMDAGDDVEMFAVVAETFFESVYYWLPEGEEPVVMPLPRKVSPQEFFNGQFVFTIEEDWAPDGSDTTYTAGSLLSFDFAAFRDTRELPPVHVVFAPGARSSIEGVSATASKVIVTVYENVVGTAYLYDFADGAWTHEALDLPDNGSLGVYSANRDSDIAFINQESFIVPDTLWHVDTSTGETQVAKSAPARFVADDLVVEQHEAISSDGERIPFFIIHKRGMAHDGSNPTLLYGYGGFQISMTPSYSGIRGKLWLERGGVFVLANIRGGGEFGPAWHQAGLKTNRQIIYDDFIAVAEELIDHGVTSPRRLGVMGGSNGGLLMGVMFTQRPDLWNAVVCQVPLLDMLRYHTLLAGASWIGEYGDPDIPEERAFLESISPYHNTDPDADYPEIFFVTSTKDDRVHPAHARKMAALLEEQGHSFLYYENTDGGHSAAANLAETAKRTALEYTYLTRKLMDDEEPEG